MMLRRLIFYIFMVFLMSMIFQPALFAKRNSEKLTTEDRTFLAGLFGGQGVEKRVLAAVFNDRRIRFMPGLVKQNVVNRENPFNYQQFLQPTAISQAKKFSRKWRTRLKRAEDKYGVDREVIVAILLVESRFGRCRGRDRVISVFASILLEHHDKRKRARLEMLQTEAEKEKYLKRIDKKARWAKQELLALLKIKTERKIDIFQLRGSYAGAFGMPQFLPSSYLAYACTSDQGARPDLNYAPDAIVSVANYLKAHGWRMDQTKEAAEKAVWAYNRSTVYVKTVLGVAEILKNK